MTNAITVTGASKRYGDFSALDNVDFVVPTGSLTALLGPSGSGKSTLLRAIAGLDTPDSGTITINGRDVTGVPPQRRGIGFVFQHYAAFKHLTVRDNVAFGLKIRKLPKSEIKDKVDNLLEVVGLAGFQTRYPTQLSGGQIQRVALARALANRPSVLLLDEPLSALDLKLRQHMQLELREIQRELAATFVYVTHDQTEALVMSDRIAVMNVGRIVQIGTPREIYARPVSIFASDFIGETNLIHGRVLGVVGEYIEVDIAGAGISSGCAGAPVSVGDQVTLSIRPEALRVRDPATALNSSASCLPGTVRAVIFLGSHTRLKIDIGNGTYLQADLSDDDSREFSAGDPVCVEWTNDAAVVWPKDNGGQG